ncbi:hypothetical protein [Bacillus sp. C1]
MKKFAISYLVCLMFFSIFVNVLQYIQEPNYTEAWGSIWASIIMYMIFGSIPVFIGCLLGEFFYRKIKRSYELKIGIPLFVLLGVFYGCLIGIGISFTMLDFVKNSIPITLSSLVFYFIRRI